MSVRKRFLLLGGRSLNQRLSHLCFWGNAGSASVACESLVGQPVEHEYFITKSQCLPFGKGWICATFFQLRFLNYTRQLVWAPWLLKNYGEVSSWWGNQVGKAQGDFQEFKRIFWPARRASEQLSWSLMLIRQPTRKFCFSSPRFFWEVGEQTERPISMIYGEIISNGNQAALVSLVLPQEPVTQDVL